MNYHLAQINIAKFRLPQEHEANADFVSNLDRVNATAEAQPGFIWRFKGSGNDALDVQAFDDPMLAVNMSVWADMESLIKFVYRNEAHVSIMRRRKEWFDRVEIYQALWWVEKDRLPTLYEAKLRLELLRINGPSYSAFTFKKAYAPPSGELLKVF